MAQFNTEPKNEDKVIKNQKLLFSDSLGCSGGLGVSKQADAVGDVSYKTTF